MRWQPTAWDGPQDASKLSFVVLYVGNLQRGKAPWMPQNWIRVCSAVCWQPTGLLCSVGQGLELYVGNLHVLCALLDRVWGCMLATYRSYGRCWTGCGAVCWQPTGLMGSVGPGLGLYVGNLQVLWALLDRATALYVGNLHVLWALLDRGLGLYVGNLQVLWALLDRVWGCMLATYRSYARCWTGFGAVCWQPTCLMNLMSSVGPF